MNPEHSNQENHIEEMYAWLSQVEELNDNEAAQVNGGELTPRDTVILQTVTVEYGVIQTGLSGSIDKIAKGMDSTVNKI